VRVATEFWPAVRIGDLGKVFTGRTPPTEKRIFFGQDFPFITPGDMHQGKYARQTQRYLSTEGAALLNRILLPADSVCVSCIGWQMGEAIMTDRPSFSNQQINTIVPNGAVDPSFLYYSLRPRKQELLSLGAATGVRTPIMNKSAFCDLKVTLPPLPLQRRIAGILSAYDDLVENCQRRIKILEEMARSLYREWFVDFRFPGQETCPRVPSPLGEIPEGWEVKRLEEIASVNHSQITARTAPESIHYIDIASVSPGQVDTVTTYAFADAPGRARRIVGHGDVLWSCVRPNRRSHALLIHPETDTIASTGFAVLTALSVPFTFLYQATTTDEFVRYLTNNATGAAYPAVTGATFQRAELLIPPAHLTRQFEAISIPMVEQIHTLQRQSRTLRRTRDHLLPRLLSGQVELEDS
jgi:type I restriction enzyme S subunit